MEQSIIQKEASNVLKGRSSLIASIKDEVGYIDRAKEHGMIVNANGAGIIAREDGTSSMTTGTLSQVRTDGVGDKTIEQSIESNLITVRRKIDTDEIIINNHKLNPDLYELTDMKENLDGGAIGNLTMFSTVLVKAWEPTLKKYVLIRRLARVPVFSNMTNLPIVPKELDIDTNISEELLKISKRGEK